MAHRQFTLAEGVVIDVYKRRGNRNLRMSVTPRGVVRVSIPTWAPYKAGVAFAQARIDWIKQQSRPTVLLTHNQAVGKAHHLNFEVADVARPTSRLSGSSITIRYPAHLTAGSEAVQAAAQRAAVRALRQQAEQLLPQRLASLAKQHDFTYASVSIKQLRGRWGSCDQNKHIVLNLYLMQLPWELIDYVILHELVHTRILKHGPPFWAEMEQYVSKLSAIRKQMRAQQPILHGSVVPPMA